MQLQILALALALLPSVANALGATMVDVRTTGASTTELRSGDQITFDLRLDNTENDALAVMDFIVFGYDPDRNDLADNGLQWLSAEQSDSFFNQIHVAGASFGGLSPIRPPSGEFPREFSGRVQGSNDPEFGTPVGLFLQVLAVGRSLGNPTPLGDGSLDIGVDGDLVGEGDVHLRVVFEATDVSVASDLTLQFGLGDPRQDGTVQSYSVGIVGSNGRLRPFDNASWSLRVLPIPEPSTAILLMLGLCGLSRARVRAA